MASAEDPSSPTMRHEPLILSDATLLAERAALPAEGAPAAAPKISIVDLPENLEARHAIEESFGANLAVCQMHFRF